MIAASFTGTFDYPTKPRFVDAARSLLVIIGSAPSNPHYDDFHQKVNFYNSEPPFNYPNPFKIPKQVGYY